MIAGAEYEEEGGHVQGPLLMLGTLVCMGLVVPWYMASSEAVVVEAVQYLRTVLILLPLLLLFALRLLSAPQGLEQAEAATSGMWSVLWTAFEPSSRAQEEVAVGSPVMVAVFLAIIFFMMWYQSGFQQYWHPIVRS
ncbi:hypothetical protein GOP47_0011930 [Adiantum capillus-veneris]|uniref:Uncharacterized protein n=1 Tax=Adiantum capillus-veneris TaxID=13818 RepID=A0A9D4UUX6_ADICA|nr:hypothetical protein GOP47_0011930 [Adiantum capillus-veneris]